MRTFAPLLSTTLSQMSNSHVSHFAERAEESNKGFALCQSARKTQTRIRAAQSARILELQIEVEQFDFLAEFTSGHGAK